MKLATEWDSVECILANTNDPKASTVAGALALIRPVAIKASEINKPRGLLAHLNAGGNEGINPHDHKLTTEHQMFPQRLG